MDQSRLSLLALHFIPGLGDYLIRQLVGYCGSAEKVFKTPKGKLQKIPGIGRKTATLIQTGTAFARAEQEIRNCERNNIALVFFTDATYPRRLRAIDDAPTLLYLKGNIDLDPPKTVGIVGTRRATNYGRHCIEELVNGLKALKPLIVSGLAYGIDILAHRQALDCDLPTIGILGSGVDVIYPSAHREVATRMEADGGLVSELPLGTKPDAHNFPARNRIIAGLADALIVVEAGETGGALITADIANSYNKDVFAFPGNIGQSYSYGCNHLIKTNKASLITSSADLEYMMNWDQEAAPVAQPVLNLDEFGEHEQKVLLTLHEHGGTLVIDELSWKSNLPVSQLASILLTLEFRGAVQSLPGKLFRLARARK